MAWPTLLLVLLFGGVILWLLRNAEARVLTRELGRYGLYLFASMIQNVSGRPVGYVQHYKDSVARDAGLKPAKDEPGADTVKGDHDRGR